MALAVSLSAVHSMSEFRLAPSDVLHLDNSVLAVVKPAGCLSQPDATGDTDIVELAKAYVQEATGERDPFLGLVHRLDRPASGVMVLARTSDAARQLSEQFHDRLTEKRYLAAVEGRMTGLGTCTGYIAKVGREPKVVGPEHPDGKRAVLQWQAVAPAEPELGEHASVVQVQLHTGRSHQIRLQLAGEGHPIIGDFRHGASTELDGRNLALHQTLLRVEHPDTFRMLTFEAPVPTTWRNVLSDRQWRKL
jgi:tRNA pseudouridine32 synthase/23S rRNA pseudouridine746 synthase/23S rRNA pseudouridine1911/1915/1917 synthase